jgi:hypothetical protein
MSDDRTVIKVFLGKPDGRRKVGRPKLRWLACIENDLKSMDVMRWRKKAVDRSVWASILKEVLVKTVRAVCQRRKRRAIRVCICVCMS